MLNPRAIVFAVLCALLATATKAADFAGFRGPNGNGVTDEAEAPIEWSATRNIKWKAPLPRPGNGSPIVSNERVFITSAEDADGKQRSLYCFDRESGKPLWVKTVDFGKKMPTHKQNPYCGSTPAANGKRVVVWEGSAGLHCYDFDGNNIWSRDLGEFRHIWGYGSSPVLEGDKVILHSGPGERIFMAAFELSSGKTIWQTEEPRQGQGSEREDGKYMGSWCTPIIISVNGRDQIVCTMPTRVIAYDLEDGGIIWSCEGIRHERGDLSYSSPIIAGDICVAIGGYRGPAIGIQLGGTGDLTQKGRLWRHENQPQSIGSGVFLDGYIYRPNDHAKAIECLDPKTGEIVWSDRGGGANWGSIVYAAGRCYVTSKNGTTAVFAPTPEKCDLLAKNRLGEPSNSTPAISNGEIFIRTFDHLYCIGD